jgi:diguanylate cyclase (GGDEF)-like protein
MISIRSELTELEKSHQLAESALDCYLCAIRNVDHYALELDELLVKEFRKNMGALADELSTRRWEALDDSRATFRALLRDYRDRCSTHLGILRDELAGTVRALEALLDSLNESDGDHEVRLRAALANLRQIAGADPTGVLSLVVSSAADAIEQSVDQLKKQHQLSISQFQTEIRVLHQRIDSLEKAASVDQLTSLANRSEMVERIKLSVTGEYCLLLIGVRGLLRTEVTHGKEVGQELVAAFAKRLGNCIPPDAVAARWSVEEFVVIAKLRKREALELARWITDNLSGAYSCLKGGKAVRPSIQAGVSIVETFTNETPEQVLQRVGGFLVRS